MTDFAQHFKEIFKGNSVEQRMFRVHLTSVVDTKATAITLQVGESSFSFVYSCPPPIRLLSLLYAGTVYPCIGLSLHAHACRVRFSNYSWGAYFRRTHETCQPHVIPFLFASSSQCSLFVTIILFTCPHFMFSFATSTSSSIKFLCFAVSNKCHNYLYLRSSLFFTISLCCIFLLLLLSSFDAILTNCILACFPIYSPSRNQFAKPLEISTAPNVPVHSSWSIIPISPLRLPHGSAFPKYATSRHQTFSDDGGDLPHAIGICTARETYDIPAIHLKRPRIQSKNMSCKSTSARPT